MTVKVLSVLRHTKKNGHLTSQAGLDMLKSLKIRHIELTTDLFMTAIGRTAQTALAAVVHLKLREVVRVHAPISELGNDEQVTMMTEAGYADAHDETSNALSATKACLGSIGYAKLLETLMVGLHKAFDAMPDTSRGLMIGHGGFIEAVAEAAGGDPGLVELDYLEGFSFKQDDGGTITVIGRI